VVPGWRSGVVIATLKATGKELPVETGAGGLTLTLPATPPDRISSTIVLEVKGALASN
jgi:hypothetical protein